MRAPRLSIEALEHRTLLSGLGPAVTPALTVTLQALHPTEGVPLNNAILATFTEGNSLDKASSYSAGIQWGDTRLGGLPQKAMIQTDPHHPGVFVVVGSHTYSEEATNLKVAITITDLAHGLTVPKTESVDVKDGNLAVTAIAPIFFEGVEKKNPLVARFTDDNPDARASDFTATVVVDQQTFTGQVQADPTNPGKFDVTYAGGTFNEEQGPFNLTVTVTDVGGAVNSSVVPISVLDAAPVVTLAPPRPTEGHALRSVKVATFTVQDPNEVGFDFHATIYWGDGATDIFPYTSVVEDAPGHFSVYGSHTYGDEASNLKFGVTVTDFVGSASGTGNALINVADAPIASLKLAPLRCTENMMLNNVVVATFNTGTARLSPNNFTATIDWGDSPHVPPGGATPPVANNAVIQVNRDGTYGVVGSHTYGGEQGPLTFKVTVHDEGGKSASITAPIRIVDAPLSLASSQDGPGVFPHDAVEGVPTGQIEVARFIDADPRATTASYQATIHWGDGQISTGTDVTFATNDDGTVSVRGQHTYAEEARHLPFSVEVRDNDGARLITPATFAWSGRGGAAVILPVEVDVADAPITMTINPHFPSLTEGKTLTDFPVATFTDPDPNASLADYHADIDWGDGAVRAAGIVQNPDGSFSVIGGHKYYEAAPNLTIQVSLQDGLLGLGGGTFSADGVIHVQEAALAMTSIDVPHAEEGVPFDQEVATFTDASPTSTASDFTAEIQWGDGTTTTSTNITSVNNAEGFEGHTYKVDAQHTYEQEVKAGLFRVKIIDGLTATGGVNSDALGSPNLRVSDVPLTEGTTLAGVFYPKPTAKVSYTDILAAYTDPVGDTDQQATIDWGDGATSAGTITPISFGNFGFSGDLGGGAGQSSSNPSTRLAVFGTHTYATPGSKSYSVTVTDPSSAKLLVLTGTLDVQADLSGMSTYVNQSLANLQSYLDNQVFDNPLPLIGRQLQGAQVGQIIDGFRQNLADQLSSVSFDPDSIQHAIVAALGNQGGLGLLVGGVTVADHSTDATLPPGGLSFDFHLHQNPSINVGQVGFDLGLPGLPFTSGDTSGITVNVGYDLGMKITAVPSGAQTAFSFALDNCSVTVGANITGVKLSLDLGLLTGSISQDPLNKSSFSATYSVNFGTDPLGNPTASTTISGGADINLLLDLTFGAKPVTFDLSSGFHLGWTFDSNAADFPLGTLQDVSFNNIQLHVGTFLANFLAPVIDDVKKVTEPLVPLANLITDPLPVLSDVANAVGRRPPSLESLGLGDGGELANLAGFIEYMHTVSVGSGDIDLDLGSFSVTDPRATGPNQAQSAAIVANPTPYASDQAHHLSYSPVTPSQVRPADVTNPAPADNLVQTLSNNGIGIFATLEGYGFAFPILDAPIDNISQLFLGNPVKLFTYTINKSFPALQLDYVIPIFPVPLITAEFTGSVDFEAHATLGYDTSGITSGNPLNGFFIQDCRFSVTADASAKVNASFLVAQAQGGANLSVNFTLNLVNGATGQSELRFDDLGSIAIQPAYSFSGSVYLEGDLGTSPFDICAIKLTFGSLVLENGHLHSNGPSLGC
jgi:hypothetical protein